MKRRRLFSAIGLLLGTLSAQASDGFVVSDIRVEGLQRISAGTVFAAMPINVGDQVSPDGVSAAIRSLFQTGNFDDVQIAHEGGVMVVKVQERPSISEIKIDGNKALKTEMLLDGLKKQGLAEGQVFKRSTLEMMRQELTRQYVSQGRYDANIQTDIVAEPRNRVSVNINIDEGNTAKIKSITIIGNTKFDNETLRDLFELKTTGWLSWLNDNDKYSREKLKGDLEKLNSYYLDRGYTKFRVDSTQVATTPDRKAVYVTINVIEGAEYKVGKVDLSGDIILPEEELRKFILVQNGQTFSQALVTNTEQLLTKRLGNEGYNFAKVKGVPETAEDGNIVDIKFFVDPGKRTYVNRINFAGNSRTADDVMRREMRQMEGAPASSDKIEQSRVRLERLGYFKEAKVDTQEVPGSDDLIDLKYNVEEQPSGSIGASIGFAQGTGLVLGANLQENNFLGSGKQVGIGLNRSKYLTDVRFSYVDPYFTEDGVSRGFSVFHRKAELGKINIANYTTSTTGGTVTFGYPLSETQRLGFTFGAARTSIDAGYGTPLEIVGSPRPLKDIDNYYDVDATGTPITAVPTPNQGLAVGPRPLDRSLFYDPLVNGKGFLDVYGSSYNELTFTTAWTESTLNRGQLATRGHSQSVSLEIALPGSDLEYYKLSYNAQLFLPLTDTLTTRFHLELGYGNGYGNLDQLPFYSNFFAGGFSSVRGFEASSLGPRGTPAIIYNTTYDASLVEGYARAPGAPKYSKYSYDELHKSDPIGGNVLVTGGAELLFPLPFIKDQRSIRTALFVDSGQVFSTNCGATQVNCYGVDLSKLVYSAGFGLTWITGFGPLTFSIAKPLRDSEFDRTEFFQFSLGAGF
ncbi:MAG: outer membrane protein assembly factor BamA [Verrucomicrobiaceae bacterium]|nr:outer membrane protein assembly factor BamA [Verrucomicrobiaceae bacterium]